MRLMVEFYKNKTNFIFIFNKEDNKDCQEFPFIFEEVQYNRLFPILELNKKNNLYLSINTRFVFYKKKEIIKIIIRKPEHINKKKNNSFPTFFNKLFTYYKS